MSTLQLLSLAILTALIAGQRSFAQFQIRKRHTSNDKSSVVGKLTLNIMHQYNTIEPSIQAYSQELITKEDFVDGHQAILEFVCVQTDMQEYKDRVYMTSVDQISQEQHGQKIALVLGPQSQTVTINAINYVQTRERVGEVFTEIAETKVKEDTVIKLEHQAKKSEAENQSFFSKYKWPLIIGGVVVYTMMSSSGGAGAAGGAAR